MKKKEVKKVEWKVYTPEQYLKLAEKRERKMEKELQGYSFSITVRWNTDNKPNYVLRFSSKLSAEQIKKQKTNLSVDVFGSHFYFGKKGYELFLGKFLGTFSKSICENVINNYRIKIKKGEDTKIIWQLEKTEANTYNIL